MLWVALRRAGRSRAWLAHAAGISVATLDDWRSGRADPSASRLVRCFGALRLDLLPVPRPERVPRNKAAEAAARAPAQVDVITPPAKAGGFSD